MTLKTLAGLATALALTLLPFGASASTPASAPAHFHSYVRVWVGHDRTLDVRSDHTAKEVVYDGCCTHALTLKLSLGDVRGTTDHGSVAATVTKVVFVDPSEYSSDFPAPTAGQTTRLKLRHGVLVDPLTRSSYCDARARPGACGA